jgi:hypothetical protein
MDAADLQKAMQDMTMLRVGSSRGIIVGLCIKYQRGGQLEAHDIEAFVEDSTGELTVRRRNVHHSEFRVIVPEEAKETSGG